MTHVKRMWGKKWEKDKAVTTASIMSTSCVEIISKKEVEVKKKG